MIGHDDILMTAMCFGTGTARKTADGLKTDVTTRNGELDLNEWDEQQKVWSEIKTRRQQMLLTMLPINKVPVAVLKTPQVSPEQNDCLT